MNVFVGMGLRDRVPDILKYYNRRGARRGVFSASLRLCGYNKNTYMVQFPQIPVRVISTLRALP